MYSPELMKYLFNYQKTETKKVEKEVKPKKEYFSVPKFFAPVILATEKKY